MIDLIVVFSEPQAWVELATLTFLEMVLGIDNLVFIAITTDRLPENRKSLGRKLGLCGALVMRVLLLCCVSWLMSLENPLVTIPFLSGEMGLVTAKELIMIAGGIYLIYKGIGELVSKVNLHDEEAEMTGDPFKSKRIGLLQAIALIMMMDIIFSLDSVITATGMVNDLPIMIIAVMLAVAIMIIFADLISNFINRYSGIKILALSFIVMVGVVLVCEGLSVHLDKAAVYFAMGFALIVQIVEIRWSFRGALVSMGILTVICIALNILMPDAIYPGMWVSGILLSAVILVLLRKYETNLDKMHETHRIAGRADLERETKTTGDADAAKASTEEAGAKIGA